MNDYNYLNKLDTAALAESTSTFGLNTFKHLMGLLEPFKSYIIIAIILIGAFFIIKWIVAKLLIIVVIVGFIFFFSTDNNFLAKEKRLFKAEFNKVSNGVVNDAIDTFVPRY